MNIEWRILVDPWLPGETADKASLERAAQAVLDAEAERLPGKYQACVVLTDDQDIRRINRQTRGIDSATDVLSFPQARLPRRGAVRIDPKRLRALLDPDTGCRHLGDVVISVERARAQAVRYGHGLRRELGYLLVHGMCHLLGYDHVREEDKAHMRAAEEAAMGRAGLSREETNEGDCPMNDNELLALAREAMDSAYVPYSNYAVGACLLAEDGRVFAGCNVENASYGATICAERTAVVKAVSEGARRFAAIAVAARGSAPYPCGICRQILNEFGPKMRVLVTWDGAHVEKTMVEKTTLDALLPHSFGPESLGENESLGEKS